MSPCKWSTYIRHNCGLHKYLKVINISSSVCLMCLVIGYLCCGLPLSNPSCLWVGLVLGGVEVGGAFTSFFPLYGRCTYVFLCFIRSCWKPRRPPSVCFHIFLSSLWAGWTERLLGYVGLWGSPRGTQGVAGSFLMMTENKDGRKEEEERRRRSTSVGIPWRGLESDKCLTRSDG